MAQGIKAGTIWVNCYGAIDFGVGFGGYKMSGYGWKGGAEHVDSFLYQKAVLHEHCLRRRCARKSIATRSSCEEGAGSLAHSRRVLCDGVMRDRISIGASEPRCLGDCMTRLRWSQPCGLPNASRMSASS